METSHALKNKKSETSKELSSTEPLNFWKNGFFILITFSNLLL